MLFQLHQVVWSLWKGLLEESLKQGELTRVDSGGLMQQGKHSLGHLFMEWHIVRPKTMLILLLCHLQVRPLCSNTPQPQTLIKRDHIEDNIEALAVLMRPSRTHRGPDA